ncbi:cystathionine gamma-lyase [Streptomyces sp. WMMB303]|uniref:cystathionine gamma-lyase n=1 Tax=unclassified Streptomyces TaxID=2593676 RepID=UPI0023EB8B72|nr:cystathionine gamma-lyase [Streptomyces sp. WMMB303]MDF4251661.1 cystathionine gamma-lyase [Streptomyces sp. WMMB303]
MTAPEDPPFTGPHLDYGPANDADGTRVVRAGLPAEEPYEPPLPGPVFAAHYHLPGEVEGAPYAYGRDANPTWTHLEQALAELEAPGDPDTEVVVFSSGMGAISAVLLSQARPGRTVVLPSDGYNLLSALHERLESFGVRVRTAPTGGDGQLAELEGADLLWLETPSNPGLDVCDIRKLAAAAHESGALVAVDNTLATPLGQRPLLLGADISVASGTKALTGHGDVLLGYVATRNPDIAAAVRGWRKTVGAIPGPMEAWLAHRSLATLDVRTQRQAGNALAVAEALAVRPEVRNVRHPGLPQDPAHPLAARQMSRYGCVVSCTLSDQAFANRFLGRLRLVNDATSFGGVRSTAERRGRWGGDAVSDGFVRLSVGVEDSVDLVTDIRRALDQAG